MYVCILPPLKLEIILTERGDKFMTYHVSSVSLFEEEYGKNDLARKIKNNRVSKCQKYKL